MEVNTAYNGGLDVRAVQEAKDLGAGGRNVKETLTAAPHNRMG